MKIAIALLAAALLLGAAAYLRAPEYDEAYSIFLTAGDARPAWPSGVFQPKDVRALYQGHASMAQIAKNLRYGDVHPPLYFWTLELWRRIAGPSWFAARLLSVLYTLGALGALAWLAAQAEIPVIPAILIALLSYGFAYTGIVARGFALAQLLNVLGLALIFAAARKDRAVPALTGGMLLGAASFSNYLACFTGLAALLWLLLENRRRLIPAAIGFALFLPADLYFFVAQKSSRIGQFVAFSWPRALVHLAKDSGAALFGGLPLYAGRFDVVVAVALGLLFYACLSLVWWRWRPPYKLFAMAAAATPLGLLALGLIFHNTPIEIRYLAFSLPFVALLFAGLPKPLLIVLLAVQACAIFGLVTAASTMQPQGLAARQIGALHMPGALVLLPYGNDGVGIPGPFIAAASDNMQILLIKPGKPPNLSRAQNIILPILTVDAASRTAAIQTLEMLDADKCWKNVEATNLTAVFSRICPDSWPAH
jgi:hypothetical protein